MVLSTSNLIEIIIIGGKHLTHFSRSMGQTYYKSRGTVDFEPIQEKNQHKTSSNCQNITVVRKSESRKWILVSEFSQADHQQLFLHMCTENVAKTAPKWCQITEIWSP